MSALWTRGQFMSCFCLGTVVAVVFTFGTISRFRTNANLRATYISEMHDAYDSAVEAWTSTNRALLSSKLSSVSVYSTDRPQTVLPMDVALDKDPDVSYKDAPVYEHLAWHVDNLYLDAILSDPDARVGQEYTIVVNGTLNGTPILALSIKLPFIKSTISKSSQFECCQAEGLWRGADVGCVSYQQLSNLCFGVKYTQAGGVEQWEVEDGDEGCYPTNKGEDGTSFASAATYQPIRVGDLLSAQYKDLSPVEIELRSNDDPYLVAMDVTDGTLMFDQVPPFSERYWEIVGNARMGVLYGVIGGVALVFMLIMWTNRDEMIDNSDDAGFSSDAARNKRFRRGPEALGLKKNRAAEGSYEPLQGDYRPPAAI